MKIALFLFLLSVFNPSSPGTTGKYNILDFGAKPDGVTLNSASIQAAIDKAAMDGGGQVTVPAGRFLTGTIVLKSGVELYLDPKAVLLGSTSPYDYPAFESILVSNTPSPQYLGALIEGKGLQDIAISGKGTIDGQGRKLALTIDSLFYAGKLDSSHYNLRRKRPGARPGNIKLVECNRVKITGVTIKDAAGWVQTYDLCTDLTLDHIRVESDAYWNNDGIDIVDCMNVRVTNSYVNAADDGICLKSEHPGKTNENVLIANCTVRSSASAVKFGTASVGGFKNVVVRNIKVFDTFRSAIALESVDGGILENILVDSINAVNTGNAIFIKLGHRNKEGKIGTLRNIVVRNVKVQVPFGRPDLNYDLRGPALSFFHNTFPSSITGLPGHPVENVLLENIEISYPGRGNDGLAILPLYRLKDVPEAADQYPEFSMFGELPAWGFYVRHAEGLIFKNVTVIAREKDYRPGYVFDDVKGLNLSKCSARENDKGKQFIMFHVKDPVLGVDKSLVQTIAE
ncbi:MAG: glycoside hydrolase family 28 protein [Terrimonas sp.]|nr:glycoside hydrolase family 28 protein [Terrimonas sp.]